MGLMDGTAWEKEFGYITTELPAERYKKIRNLQDQVGGDEEFTSMVKNTPTAGALFIAQEMMENRAAIMLMVFIADIDQSEFSLLDIAEIIESVITPPQIKAIVTLLKAEGYNNMFGSLA